MILYAFLVIQRMCACAVVWLCVRTRMCVKEFDSPDVSPYCVYRSNRGTRFFVKSVWVSEMGRWAKPRRTNSLCARNAIKCDSTNLGVSRRWPGSIICHLVCLFQQVDTNWVSCTDPLATKKREWFMLSDAFLFLSFFLSFFLFTISYSLLTKVSFFLSFFLFFLSFQSLLTSYSLFNWAFLFVCVCVCFFFVSFFLFLSLTLSFNIIFIVRLNQHSFFLSFFLSFPCLLLSLSSLYLTKLPSFLPSLFVCLFVCFFVSLFVSFFLYTELAKFISSLFLPYLYQFSDFYIF